MRASHLASALALASWSLFSACGNDGGPRTDERTDTNTVPSPPIHMGDGDDVSSGDGDKAALGGQGGNGGSTPVDDPRLPTALDFNCGSPEGVIPSLTLTEVASDIFIPLQMSPIPGDDSRLWVISQKGHIEVIKDGAKLETQALNIEHLVARSTIEEGLLGLAIHPDYQENGLFYVHYNARNEHPVASPGSTVIEEYRISDNDPDVADPDSGRVVFIGPREQREGADHNGGGLFFGRDNLLHATLGDGGGVTVSSEGQNLESYLGSIVRFDPLADLGKGAPEANAFDPNALPEIWAYGLRNPFRGTADGCTGDVYVGDVGFNSYEEVNILRPGDVGINFGWPDKEGNECAGGACDGDYTDPAYLYPTAVSGSSVTGGSVYRGNAIPALRGRYFFADATSGQVWSAAPDVTARTLNDVIEHTTELTKLVITSIDTDNHGELYFVSRLDGAIYKLEAR